MKIHCVADLHGHIPVVPTCDLLLLAGDYWGYGYCYGTEKSQAKWLADHLAPWFTELREKLIVQREIVGIAGNHDGIFHTQHSNPEFRVPEMDWTYLQDSDVLVDVEGEDLRIWGTPWSPWFMDWAFSAPREDRDVDDFMRMVYSSVPEGTDILISHGPPYEILDLTNEYEHAGSRALVETIERVKPGLVVCGHVHEAMGIKTVGSTTVVNAAIVGPRGHRKRSDGFTFEGPDIRNLTLV